MRNQVSAVTGNDRFCNQTREVKPSLARRRHVPDLALAKTSRRVTWTMSGVVWVIAP